MPRKVKHPTTMMLLQFGIAGGLILVVIALGSMGGCKPYQKEVRRTGLLTKLVEQQQGTRKSMNPENVHPVFGIPEGKIRHEHEDGTVTLYAKSIKHLMNHIIYALENNEREVFVDQILSQITIQEFEERGLDPGIAFDELVKRKRDVYRLYHYMPMGEFTPGMIPKPVDTNIFRLSVSRQMHRELLWIGMDASFEGGNYKLRWFVP